MQLSVWKQCFGRLVPALQRRLRTERILGEGPLALAALRALLEASPAAAFVLATSGAVLAGRILSAAG